MRPFERESGVPGGLTKTGRARQDAGAGQKAGDGERWLGLGLVTLAGVAFGVQGVLAKVAYDGGADVPTVLAVRFGIAAIAVWGVFAARRGGGDRPAAAPIGARRRLGFAILGLLFVTSALFAYLALERLPAGTTALIVFVYPALVVLWTRLLFGEPLTPRRSAALVLALTGCVMTVAPSADLGGAALSGVGILFALGSALSNSWYATLAGPIGRGVPGLRAAVSSVPVTAVCFLGGLVALGGPAAGVSAVGWAATVGIGLLTALSVTAFLAGVALVGSSRAAIVSTSEPAIAVALGALFLGESVTALGVMGGLCIVGAILLLATGSAPEAKDEVPPLALPTVGRTSAN